MSVGRLCVRSVYLARPEESVRVVARRMHEQDVGALVVVDQQGDPVGIVTDRDLVLRCLAADRDPSETRVESVMTTPVASVAEATPIEDALKRMSGSAARRLVVTDEKGKVAGILALDDVIELLVEEAESIGRLLRQRPPRIEDSGPTRGRGHGVRACGFGGDAVARSDRGSATAVSASGCG